MDKLQQLRVQLAKLLPILLKSMDLGMSLTALSSNEGGDPSKGWIESWMKDQEALQEIYRKLYRKLSANKTKVKNK